ncbi:MAG: hypothetical protein U0Q16_35385 [Bryobacteraceae bacterium]
MISLLMEQRFGPLSKATKERIETASGRQIRKWAVKLVTAKRIEDVFA